MAGREKLEDRIAALEVKFTEWEARRRKLIPEGLEQNGNVQMLMKDCLQNYYEKMRSFANQSALDQQTTEMNRLRQEAAYELEQRQKREVAEIIEAIEYYERTGQSPPGYCISG